MEERAAAKKKHRLTPVSILHYVKLVYRSALFLLALLWYIPVKIKYGEIVLKLLSKPWILWALWLVFVVEMLLRFIPSKLESPGCQKQFKRNYKKSGKTDIVVQDNNATMLVALVWISFNALFGIFHMLGIFDDGIMILLSCAYSVCDMICILFFCPFQSWFLKNKCCSSCRIYNWDYAMMFTPLFFIKGFYSWSLLILSIILMIRWEIAFYRHPEYFSEETNEYLKCANCTEKLCTHKKQLHGLWLRVAEFTAERTKRLLK